MVDSGSLRIESVARGPILYVRLYGAIDETFDVSAILEAGEGKDLIINTKSVARISSFGVREWVKGINRLATIKNRIVLVDCSPVIVMHLNTVANFSDHCDVVSIQAPYFCEACSWDTEVTLEVTEKGVSPPAKAVSCRRCNSEMKLDEAPSYFSFARPERFRPLDPHISEFINSYLRANEPIAASTDKIPLWRRLTGWVQRHRRWWPHAAVAGGVGVVVLMGVLLAILATRESGVSPEVLEKYHARLAANDFEGARTLVNQLQTEGSIPGELATRMRGQVDSKRVQVRDAALSTAASLLAKKSYAQALSSYQAAAALGARGDAIHFGMAECYRRLGKAQQAYENYVRFVETFGGSDHDPRLDDALYWQADYLIKQGKPEEARPLLRRVAKELPRSNFRRSASRLLSSLK